MEEKMDIAKLIQKINTQDPEDRYNIIEETDDFIIVNKKYGIAVQATDKGQLDLEKTLQKKYKKPIYVINRIDQPVSGLVIFGKTKEFTEAFTEKFKDRSVHKTYLTLVAGTPERERTMLTHFIKKLHNRAMTSDEPVDQKFKESKLAYTLLQSFDNYHLLRIELFTGRFHQIRAQLATVDLPIKGDLKYASKRPNLDRSICLLSYKLAFEHPFTKEMHAYTAPFPDNDVLWTLIDKSLLDG